MTGAEDSHVELQSLCLQGQPGGLGGLGPSGPVVSAHLALMQCDTVFFSFLFLFFILVFPSTLREWKGPLARGALLVHQDHR